MRRTWRIPGVVVMLPTVIPDNELQGKVATTTNLHLKSQTRSPHQLGFPSLRWRWLHQWPLNILSWCLAWAMFFILFRPHLCVFWILGSMDRNFIVGVQNVCIFSGWRCTWCFIHLIHFELVNERHTDLRPYHMNLRRHR